MANNLSLSNVINVTLVPSIAGLSEFNTANLLLYSTDEPITEFGNDSYRVYYNASSVAEDFGVDSLTYKMALAVFSQTPNILSNSGALIIALKQNGEKQSEAFNRLKTQVLFCGWMTTEEIGQDVFENMSSFTLYASLEATLAAEDYATIKAVTSPSMSITVGSETTGIEFDFTEATNIDDIIEIIDSTIKETMENDKWTFGIKNGKAMIQVEDDSISSFTVEETDPSVEETTLLQTLKLDAEDNPKSTDLYIHTSLASVINAENNKINFIVSNNQEFIDSVFTEIKDGGLQKTRCLFYGGTETDAKIMMAANASRGMSTIFEASLTTQTMHLKPLTGVLPDPIMTETLLSKCKSVGVDTYVSIEGVPCVFSTGANGFFDEVFNELWFVNAIQTAGFNYLRQTNTKIPQTENGMTGLKNAYAQVCVRGVNNGFIAPGTWTSSDTFGNPDLFKRNIETSGFYIYSTPVAQQSKADREDRKAPLVQIAVKTAGAIHSTNVMIYVNL